MMVKDLGGDPPVEGLAGWTFERRSDGLVMACVAEPGRSTPTTSAQGAFKCSAVAARLKPEAAPIPTATSTRSPERAVSSGKSRPVCRITRSTCLAVDSDRSTRLVIPALGRRVPEHHIET